MERAHPLREEGDRRKVAPSELQTTCYHVKKDTWSLGGGDTLVTCLTAVGGKSSLNSCGTSPCPWISQQMVLPGFAAHPASNHLFLISLVYFYDTWITWVCVNDSFLTHREWRWYGRKSLSMGISVELNRTAHILLHNVRGNETLTMLEVR